MLTGRSISGKNFLEPESSGVVTRLGRVAGFIVATTTAHPHPTLLQRFRHTDSGHTSAQVVVVLLVVVHLAVAFPEEVEAGAESDT